MYMLRPFITIILFIISATVIAGSSNATLSKLKVRPQAPEFILQDIHGKQHALSDYHGKVIVINFWASWCPPCVEEMPSLQKAADQLAKHHIPILGIGVGENRASVIRFLKSTPVRFTLLLDTKSETLAAWSVPSLPATLVIDQEGKIALVAIGKRDWDNPKILQQIISLLQTP